MPSRAPAGKHGAGFTYLGLIILVAVIGLVGAASLKVGSLLQRAAAEQELLDIGAAFSDALQSYAAVTPKGQRQQPPSLQELLKDSRVPFMRRHLRKVFVDPVTARAEWGLVHLGDQAGVIGVYSLSTARPLKVANFDPRFQGFENRERLSEWVFTMSGQVPVSTAARPGGSLFAPQSAPAREPRLDRPAPEAPDPALDNENPEI